MIFVDDANTAPIGRGKILDRLQRFSALRAAARRPGHAGALRAFRWRSAAKSTGDLARIHSDVEALKPLSSDLGRRDQSREEARDQIIDVLETQGGTFRSRRCCGAMQSGKRIAWRGRWTLSSSVVSWLAGVPGRKAILYVSDGLPLDPGRDLSPWAPALGSPEAGRSASPAIDGQKLRRSRALPRGDRARQPQPGRLLSHRGLRHADGPGHRIQEVLVTNRQNGLRFLAEDTGGRAMLNAADPLARAAPMGEDLTTYYSLGYQPQRPGDEAEHKIEVKVKATGAQVRHRQWYRDKPVGEAVAERTLAVMRFGPEDNPLGAGLEIVAGKKQGDSMLVPVRVQGHQLRLPHRRRRWTDVRKTCRLRWPHCGAF